MAELSSKDHPARLGTLNDLPIGGVMDRQEWLATRLQQITPSESEARRLQEALDLVRAALSEEVSIAAIYPCGSAAKHTNLSGRSEGDLLLVMRTAPTPQTLERFRLVLSRIPGVDRAESIYKAVAVRFRSGISIDVLPGAQVGLTEDGDSIPRKHRHALDGLKHVEWFRIAGHETSAHGLVRLIKHWRDLHGLSLSSFGLEVLTVEVLRGLASRRLDAGFEAVLERLASGQFAVVDPERSSNWINQRSGADAARVIRVAQESLAYLRQGNLPHVFAGAVYPSSVSGLAGAPLA